MTTEHYLSPPHNPDHSLTREPHVTLYEVSEEGELTRIGLTADEQKAVLAHREQVREHILNKAPQRLDGLDIESVTNFYGSKGLQIKPMVVLDSTDITPFMHNLARSGIDASWLSAMTQSGTTAAHQAGAYVCELGISFIVRDRDMEAVNGVALTQKRMAHEAAHSTARNSDNITLVRAQGNAMAIVERAGLLENCTVLNPQARGSFWEESFAETGARLYAQEQLGLRDGPLNHTGKLPTNSGVILPASYMVRSPNPSEGYAYNLPAYAAYALELLMYEWPGLYDEMITARNTGDFRSLERTLDDIQPGLYARFHNLSYNEQDFARGLQEVRSIVFQDQPVTTEITMDTSQAPSRSHNTSMPTPTNSHSMSLSQQPTCNVSAAPTEHSPTPLQQASTLAQDIAGNLSEVVRQIESLDLKLVTPEAQTAQRTREVANRTGREVSHGAAPVAGKPALGLNEALAHLEQRARERMGQQAQGTSQGDAVPSELETRLEAGLSSIKGAIEHMRAREEAQAADDARAKDIDQALPGDPKDNVERSGADLTIGGTIRGNISKPPQRSSGRSDDGGSRGRGRGL